MKSGLKIIHWILFLWLLIIILRFNLIIDNLLLLFNFFGLLITDSRAAATIANFSFIDSVFSSVLYVLVVPVIILYRKKIQFLQKKINF